MATGMPNHIDVLVVSLEEAEAQIAEFWADGQLLGHTLTREAGELVLVIEPPRDGRSSRPVTMTRCGC